MQFKRVEIFGSGFIIYFSKKIMKTEEIIKNELGFLITDYGFNFDYNSNGKEIWCKLTNKYGSVSWYCYQQFDEYELSIIVNGRGREILDSCLENENLLLKINKRKSFFELLFKDQRIIYWKQVSNAFKKQIINTGSLFGLKIEDNNKN